ncbi:MAG: PAS domain S-box protein [Proteobacteria bacterium]|nr:PAS domain S-box protein [Pseudomonadota bacterium]
MSLWALPSLISTLVLGLLLTYVVRRPPPGSLWAPVSAALLAVFAYAVGDLLTFHASTPGAYWASLVILYTGLIFVTPCWWLVALRFAEAHGHGFRFGRHPAVYLPFAWASVLWLGMLTNPWHGAFMTPRLGAPNLFQPLWFAHAGLGYLTAAAALGIYAVLAWRADSPSLRARFALMLAAAVGNVAGNAAYVLLPERPPFDPGAAIAWVTALLSLAGIYGTRLFALSPFALNLVMRHHRDGLLVLDRKDTLLYANPAAHAILGGQPLPLDAPALPRLAGILRDPEDPAQPVPVERLQAALQDGEESQDGVLFRFGDDGARWLRIQHTALPAWRGESIGCALMLREQTELQTTVEALRRSEETLRLVLDLVPYHVFAKSRDGRYVFVNEAMARDGGMSVEEMLGRTIDATAVPPEDAYILKRQDHELFTEGHRIFVPEQEVTDARGRKRTFQITKLPVKLPGRDEPAMLGVSVDISDEKAAQRALRESARQVRMLLESTSEGIYGIDREGRCTFCNPAAVAMLGYAGTDDLMGRDVHSLMHPVRSHGGGCPGDGCAILATPHSEVPVRIDDAVLVRRDGTSFPVIYRSNPLWQDGRHVGAVVTFLDDSERRRAEDALLHGQKLESLGVMAGGIAHDFNNLLVAVLGNAGIALSALDENSAAREPLRDIEKSARRASDLTRQLLAYAGKGRVRVEELDLSSVVRDVTDLLDVSIPSTVSIQYALDGDLPAVRADASQLRQIIMNLVINASDAIGGEIGTISIGTRTERVTAEEAQRESELEPGAYNVLWVEDTGTGMDAETRARIFDPFFTTKFAGRGLGLAAVLGIVRGHRGALRVESERGEGSRFEVWLPCGKLPARPRVGTPPPPETGPLSGTVLAVDDDPSVLRMLRRILETAGLTVLCAEDGVQALEVFARYRDEIDVAVLDLTMPHKSGRETARAIRAESPELPIVLSSGYPEENEVDRVEGTGPIAFLQKPYANDDLLALIREALG